MCQGLRREREWRRKRHSTQNLTIGIRIVRSGLTSHISVNFLEESSTGLQILRGPEFLVGPGRAQSLELRLFESALSIQNYSPQVNRATKVVCVLDCMRLGLPGVKVCAVKLALVEKQYPQGVMDPEQLSAPFEKGRNCEGRLEVMNGLLSIALGTIYVAKKALGLTG